MCLDDDDRLGLTWMDLELREKEEFPVRLFLESTFCIIPPLRLVFVL